MQKVKLLKRLICADVDGLEKFRGLGFVGYTDDKRAKYLLALGEVEYVDEAPEPTPEPAPAPDLETKGDSGSTSRAKSKPRSAAEAEDQPDL